MTAFEIRKYHDHSDESKKKYLKINLSTNESTGKRVNSLTSITLDLL